MALKVFGHDFGWLNFQGLENEVTYKDIIDAVVDKFDNTMPDKTNIEVNEFFIDVNKKKCILFRR